MKLLTVREVAELLRVDIRAVHRMAKAKAIPAFRLAGGNKRRGQWRFDEDKLMKWIEKEHT